MSQPCPTASVPPGIRLRDVVLHRGGTCVFDGLSLDIEDARVGLIGDNGSGKTSLFRLLCGLDAASSGRVAIGGLDAGEGGGVRPGQVGLMFQNPDDQIIFPTVAEELAFSLRGVGPGTGRREAQRVASEFLAGRGLQDWGERSIESLSQGQRQHVCLLALLIVAPRVLLLDEPYASLDLPGQARLAADVHAAADQVLVSTHVLSHVRHFERVIWLERGRVRLDGPGEAVCAAYEADVRARGGQWALAA